MNPRFGGGLRPSRLLLTLVLLLSACAGSAPPAAPTLGEVQGVAGVKLPANADFVPAQTGMALTDASILRTGADGRARLDLPSGDILRLAPASTLELTAARQPARLKLEAGRLFILLADTSAGADVETSAGVASVRGSAMMVTVDALSQDTRVTCLEGHCQAGNPAGQVQFGAGQRSLLPHRDPATGQYSAPGVEDMLQSDYQAWVDESPEAASLARQRLASAPAAPAASATPTLASAPAPSKSPPPTPTTLAAAPLLEPCIRLDNPPDGALVDYNNPVVFTWTSRVLDATYRLTIHYPDGALASFETRAAQLTRHFDTADSGQSLRWEVAALDANGNEMCRSPQAIFSSPAPEPAPTREQIVCTIGQWDNPGAPCYCDGGLNQPPYCDTKPR